MSKRKPKKPTRTATIARTVAASPPPATAAVAVRPAQSLASSLPPQPSPAKPPSVTLPDEALRNPETATFFHDMKLAGRVYGGQVMNVTDDPNTLRSTHPFVQHALKEMKPRDPIERMLVTQLLWTHARIAYLSWQASCLKHADYIAVLNHAVDGAMNAFRRHTAALAEYRRPAKQTGQITSIRQANIAQNQIVQQQVAPKKLTNEQGLNHASKAIVQADPKRLPAPPAGGKSTKAVVAKHRPAKRRRKT